MTTVDLWAPWPNKAAYRWWLLGYERGIHSGYGPGLAEGLEHFAAFIAEAQDMSRRFRGEPMFSDLATLRATYTKEALTSEQIQGRAAQSLTEWEASIA